MSDDAELDLFRASVNCAAVLETMGAGWKLDRRESTRHALKYRRDRAEILIINHDGRGWWDPLSQAKGDVFALVQHLDPSLNFGHVRRVLRRMVGVAPRYPAAFRPEKDRPIERPIPDRWARRPELRRGSPSWRYLEEMRALPSAVIAEAAARDAVRAGPHGSVWFAHRRHGQVTHVEIRGPDYKGALKGGRKTLFRFAATERGVRRVVIAEAPIDALSIAALEDRKPDTLYVATGGGMGPGTIATLECLLHTIAGMPGAVAVSATDANTAGDRYALTHADLAAAAGVGFERLRPPDTLDWNDVLKKQTA
jgi:hypothetical protein